MLTAGGHTSVWQQCGLVAVMHPRSPGAAGDNKLRIVV